MKRIVFALLIAALVVPIGFAGGQGQTADGPVTLTLAFEGTASRRDLLMTVLERFYQDHPNIRVEDVWIQMDGWADYFTKIQTMIVGGNAPDVVRVAIEGIQMMVELDLALPLNPYFDQYPALWEDYQDLHPNLQSAFEIDGNIYGATWDWNNVVTHFNLDMLEEVGLELPPEDWGRDDFLEYASALTRQRNGQRVFGVAIPDYYFAVNAFLYNFGASFLTDDQRRSALDTPEALETFQFLYDLVHTYQVAPIPEPGTGFIDRFVADQVAMVFGGRWPVESFVRNEMNFDIQYIPSFRTNQVIFGSGAFPVLTASQHPEEAFLLSAFLGGRYSQATLLAENSIPTRISLMEQVLPTAPPANSILYRTSADIARPVQSPPEYPRLGQIFARYFSAMMSQEMPVEDAVAAMHREFNEVLGVR